MPKFIFLWGPSTPFSKRPVHGVLTRRASASCHRIADPNLAPPATVTRACQVRANLRVTIQKHIHQCVLTGANVRGQTSPNEDTRRFPLFSCRLCSSYENRSIWEARMFAGNRGQPQDPGTCRELQMAVCPLRFVPFSAALIHAKSIVKEAAWPSA